MQGNCPFNPTPGQKIPENHPTWKCPPEVKENLSNIRCPNYNEAHIAESPKCKNPQVVAHRLQCDTYSRTGPTWALHLEVPAVLDFGVIGRTGRKTPMAGGRRLPVHVARDPVQPPRYASESDTEWINPQAPKEYCAAQSNAEEGDVRDAASVGPVLVDLTGEGITPREASSMAASQTTPTSRKRGRPPG